MKFFVTLACAVLGGMTTAAGAQTAPMALPRVAPTVDQILSLKRAGSPEISPDGRWVAYTVRETNWDDNAYDTQIWLADATTGATRQLTNAKKSSQSPAWSPDGSRIAFESSMANPAYFYTNSIIATVPASGGAPTALSSSFDEDPSIVAWKQTGLFFSASQHTYSYLYRLDPNTKSVTKVSPVDQTVNSSFSLSKDGQTIASLRADAKAMAEVYVGTKRLTDLNAQTGNWTTSTLEVVSWKSQDGATIEGVLHKPLAFDPARKYPLLVVIHGGPTGVSRAVPFTSATYPVDVWIAHGVLVLEPNYRGSAGYGEKFRALNVRNLGVGDAWDVLSGIDSLIAKGMVDPDKVGTMGWSQGGYVSAFLATHDAARFKAISVGAGISDWMTYYVNTDIHPFTRQYLKATPWDDPAIYAKTSPITYIKQAKTPTLIQHGATDQRVPLPNAFELYQGLLDNNVPTKLIVYQGFGGIGHGPSKPKSHRATMQHNLEWFDEYLFKTASKTSQQP
jgi:dipeptidyl aminopeptidase/acylaminoacyl peptidase